jgi:hypothetical protein
MAVVALSHELMGEQSNGNKYCGMTITITNAAGKTAQATVKDKCMGCAYNNIDVSSYVFDQLADPSAGRVQVTWTFN